MGILVKKLIIIITCCLKLTEGVYLRKSKYVGGFRESENKIWRLNQNDRKHGGF